MPALPTRSESEDARDKTVTLSAAKGGIGKTTATAQIAYPLAQFGFRVLVIDLDANAGLSTIMQTGGADAGVVEFLDDASIDPMECIADPEAWQPVEGEPFSSGGALIGGGCLHVMPANPGTAESVGRQDIQSTKRLRKALVRNNFVPDNYDLVLLDIPGADSSIVDLALEASGHLLLALLPEAQGLRGFTRTIQRALVAATESRLNFNVVGAVTTRYERSRVEHREVLRLARDILAQELGKDTPWLGLPVPSRAAVGDANRWQVPLAACGAWKDTVSNRTRGMGAAAAYAAVAVAIVRDIHGGDAADHIVDEIRNSGLGEYPVNLLLSGAGVRSAAHDNDDYPVDAPTTAHLEEE